MSYESVMGSFRHFMDIYELNRIEKKSDRVEAWTVEVC